MPRMTWKIPQPPHLMAAIANSWTEVNKKTAPSRTPTVATEVISSRRTTMAMTNQTIPLTRKTHHRSLSPDEASRSSELNIVYPP